MDMRRLARKIPLPSTREIKHEFWMIQAAAAIDAAAAGVGVKQIIAELARVNDLSQRQAQLLIERIELAADRGKDDRSVASDVMPPATAFAATALAATVVVEMNHGMMAHSAGQRRLH